MSDAIRTLLEREYCDAFSSKDIERLLPFYKRGLLVFHERDHGRNRDVKLFVGNVLGALLRGAIPAGLAFKIVYKQLAKLDYDRSRVELRSIRDNDDGSALARCRFERLDRAGKTFWKSDAVYRLEKVDNAWVIAEGWLFDADADIPAELR